jgi:hypothetical protein
MLSEALRTCDVFVFSGRTFLGGHDLRLIRQAGKRIVWVFTGTDHRPPYLNAKLVRESKHDPKRLVAEADMIRKRVHQVEAYAHAIVAHGPSSQFHRKPFAELLSVGIPVRPAQPNDIGPWPGEAGVRILHCPTDPAKGSHEIRSAVGRLRSGGLQISYLEVAGRPNAEVRTRIEQADMVIDEIYSDSPMGALAAEAAFAGVPTVVGGYWATDIRQSLPEQSIPPSAFVPPGAIEATIERLVRDASERQALGHRAREFVTTIWRPDRVAERVLSLVADNPSGIVMRDPLTLTYCLGWGMSRDSHRESVRRTIRSGGRAGLGLSHNPTLEALMLASGEGGQPGRDQC